MKNTIKAYKNNIKWITFFIDLIIPMLLFLCLENGNIALSVAIFSVIVMTKVLFILS